MRTLNLAILSLGLLVGCPHNAGPTTAADAPKGVVEDPTNPAVNFQNGLFLLQPDKKTGFVDYDGAMKAFAAAGNLNAGPKAWFNAGWAAEAADHPAEAEQYYRKAYEGDPNYDKAMYSLARVLVQNGKAGEAAVLFKTYADAHPDNVEARTDYIQALVQAGQYDVAVKEAQQILLKDPKNAAVYRNLSGLYYAQGNYSMSQLTGEKALQLNDSDAGVYNNMGVTYLIQKNDPAAIEKFKTAIKLDPKNFEANMNLGWVALGSGDYALALTCFGAALEASPTSTDAKMGLAIAKRGTGDLDGADALYREIIKADPMNQAAYFNAAKLQMYYKKDFNKAGEYLDDYKTAHAGQISPSDPVFPLIDEVAKAKAAEDARIAAEKKKKEEEEARQQRNAQLLKDLGTELSSFEQKVDANKACLDPGSVEEMSMVIEQVKAVIDQNDTDDAPDVKGLLDAYVQGLDQATAGGCAGATPAPAPAPEPAPDAPVPQ